MNYCKQFYEAACLNDTGQLNKLMEQEIESNNLEDSVSRVCMELQLNCVYLTDETKLILERKLFNLRFFNQPSKDHLNAMEICDRIGFIVKLIHNVHTCEGNDEAFILNLTFIAKQIFTLKKLLKSTYDRMPWEEIEFCVVLYIGTFMKPNEMALFYRTILSKSNIISYLTIFGDHLEKLQEYVMNSDRQEFAKLPNMKRDEATAGIIRKYPEFKFLYNDYEILRDIHSLNIMLNYVELVQSVELEEKQSTLVLIRALQVIGEHLKNTLESPRLSESTISYLLAYFSGNTRDIIIKLRNRLSHQFPSKQEELLESLENDLLFGIKSDIAKIGDKISYILSKYNIKILREVADKFLNTNDEKIIEEVVNITKNWDIISLFSRDAELKNDDVTRLKDLISQLRSKIKLKSSYLQSLFDSLDSILIEHSGKRPLDYVQGLMCFHNLYEIFYLRAKNSPDRWNTIRNMKFGVRRSINNLSPQIEPSNLNLVTEIIFSIFGVLSKELENDDVRRLCLEIVHFTKFQMNRATWTEKFGRKLWNTDKKEKVSKENITTSSKSQKKIKLLKLKELFTGITHLEYSKNRKLRATIEVLLLDLIPLLKNPNLKSRLFFLDDNYPTIMGLDLRNHLAHNNVIVDVLMDSTMATFLFVETLLNVENNQNLNLQDFVLHDLQYIENSYSRSSNVLNEKRNMFIALEKNNFEAFCECFNKGVDIRSRDVNMSTCLHFAMGKPESLKLTEFLWKKGLSCRTKNYEGQTPLHIAAIKGNPEVVEFLLNNFDIGVNDVDIYERTAAHLAALSGNEQVLNILLNHGADLSKKDRMWRSPLQYAVVSGKNAVVEVFFEKDLFYKLNEAVAGMTSLHIAAEHGFNKMVEYLILKKIQVDARQDRGGTPLHLAALNGHLETVKVLIRYGADVNSRDMNGNGAMHWACETNREEIVKVLINHGADVNMADHEGSFAPIHYVTEDGFISILEILLEHNANVNQATRFGLTPLYYAVKGRRLNVVEMLLNRKDIKVNSPDLTGRTPLHVAASNGDTEIVRMLINNGAKVNCKIIDGFNPLHLAAKFGHEAVVDLLIANRVSVQARTFEESLLPLHLAAESGNENIIKKLIKERSDINALTANGSNCLHIAIKNNRNIVSLLLQEGIKVDVKTRDHGFSPLHDAVLSKNLKMVETLVKAGSSIDTQDYLGNTPLHLATEGESSEICLFLLQNGADITVQNKNEKTPFLTAVKHKMTKFIQLCVSSSLIDDKVIYESIKTAIIDDNISIVRFLLKQLDLASDGNRILHLATTMGRVDSVVLLLKYGIGVASKNEYGDTPLHLAATNGWDEILEILLKNGAEINTQNCEGSTALHACVKNHPKCAKILLEHGADVNILDDKNRLAVELSVSTGQLDLIKLLLKENRSHLNRKGNENFTILHIAAQFGQPEVVRFLLSEGANMHSTNVNGSKPIHIAAREGFTNIVDIFIEMGMNLDVRGTEDNSLLHYATSTGRVKMVEFLLKRGCNVNSANYRGITPLLVAVIMGYEEVVKCLLNNAAIFDMNNPIKILEMCTDDKTKKIMSSVSKIFSSIAGDKIEEIKAFIEEGVPLNCVDVNKGSPLHYAVCKGNAEIVKIILQNKGLTDTAHKNGWTPLHYAVKYSHEYIVILLLWHGAKYDIVSGNGKKPIDYAENGSIRNLLKLINDCFEGIQKNNSNIVTRLKKIKDINVMKVVMRAEDKYGSTLITAAIKNVYPRLNELEEIFQENLHTQLHTAEGFLYHEKYEEAKDIYTLIFQKRKEIFGDDNPATLSIKSEIGLMLYKMQLYKQALTSMKETYEKLQKILGSDNERTLKERGFMALVLHRQGKNEESLKIFEEVHEMQEKILPLEHADVLNVKNHMALVLTSLGKLDRALKLLNDVLKFEEKKLGASHIKTMATKNNIALILSNQGKNDEAMILFQEVYQVRKFTLGPYHSDTLRALHNQINILKQQEKYDEAFEEYTKLLKCQKRYLGAQHLDTLDTQFQMANLQLARTKHFAAFKILKEIKEQKSAIQGTSHLAVDIINKLMKTIVETAKNFDINSDLDGLVENLVSTMNNAAKRGDIGTVKKLLSSGVDVGEKDVEGRNSLHFAVDGNNIEIVKLLLENNADVTEKTKKGNTVLHTASNKGYKNIAELILNSVKPDELGYLVNTATKTGKMTALHVAAKQGFLEIVQILLKKGAIYNCVNKDGKIPKDLAKDDNVKNILQLTEDIFLSLEGDYFSGKFKLHNLKKQDFLCVSNARNLQNRTILNLSILYGKLDLARIITETMKKMNDQKI